MGSNISTDPHQSWIRVAGHSDNNLERGLAEVVTSWKDSGLMPDNEPERVAGISTAIAAASFTTTPKRLEMLRSLCQIYSAGIQAGKITSHRPVVGPVIVLIKKILFRAVAALLGPSFERQRDFNAGVIRLLGDLCNERDQESRR